MKAVTNESTEESRVSRTSPAEFTGAVTAVFAASWLPVLVGVTTTAALGWLAAVALAVVVEWLTRRLVSSVLIAGLLLSSALVPGGLVTDATHYMPVAVTGGALALRITLDVWRSRGLGRLPARPVLVAVGLYLGWAAIATLASIDHRVSAVYVVGMVAVCALAFWAIPPMLTERIERERVLAALGVLGAVIALSVYFVGVVGSLDVFGRPIGYYQLADLTVAGHPTGLFFGRSSGVFLTVLEPSVLMVIGVVALLGWSLPRAGRSLMVARLAIFFTVPAILLTLDRTAWLTAIVAAGVFAAIAMVARLSAAMGAAVCLLFAACFLLVLANAVGVNAVGHACTANCVAGSNETSIRGGSGLTGREYLWQASVTAIEKRPILGYGPGNDVPAIDQFLNDHGMGLKGLTSHSTWLRTAVEMGVPGLVLLIGVFVVVAWVIGWLRGVKAIRDPVQIALVASVSGMLAAMTFESFLLGGVTFTSLYLAVALGLIVWPHGGASSQASVSDPPPQLARV